MPSFDDFASTELIREAYLRKVVVLVESAQDRDVFNEWFFDELRNLEFKPVDKPEGGGGGCREVSKQVAERRRKDRRIPCFGVVDRDALQNKHEGIFFETNDHVYQASRPLGPYIRVLLRWEMENYLLNPIALCWLRQLRPRVAETTTPAQIVTELLDHAQTLLPIIAANMALMRHGCDKLPDTIEISADNQKLHETSKIIYHKLKQHIGASGDPMCRSYEHRLRQFDDQTAADNALRWDRLNRIIDGKMMLQRILRSFALEDDIYRTLLAERMRQMNLIDDELRQLIRELIEARL